MRTLPLALCAILAACGGKKDKPADPNATNNGAQNQNNNNTNGQSANNGNAAGGEIPGLPLVTECPKSLSGEEEVNRVITKACGAVVVAETYNVKGSLTLEAGAQLKFKAGTELNVGYGTKNSKLIAKGTEQEPVLFTSADDAVPGSWKGVRIYGGANRSQLVGATIENAGDDNLGALYVEDAQDVVFKASTIKNAKDIGAKTLRASFAEFTQNNLETAGKLPVVTEAATAGSLGPNNKFAADATIQVAGNEITKDATWKNVGAPFLVTSDIAINNGSTINTLTIEAGTNVKFQSEAELGVGYNNPAKLVIKGTKESPVSFSGAERGPGKWVGIRVYSNGEATIEGLSIEDGGQSENIGAIDADIKGKLSVKASTLKNNKLGLSAANDAELIDISGDNFDANEQAIKITARNFKALAADNTYSANQKIEIFGSNINKDSAWNVQANAVVQVTDSIAIEEKATLTIPAGFALQFGDGKELGVGYASDGTIKIMGTAENPVVLRGIREEKESWSGLALYNNALASSIENVVLSNVAGEAGIRIENKTNTTLTNVSCDQCAATLRYTCESKVELKDVKAGKDTAKDVIKPTDCP